MVSPRPITTTWRALDRDVVGGQELDDAGRRAGQRAVGSHDQPAQVHRVEAVDVLVRVDGQEHPLLVEAGREGELHQVGVDRRVGVELGHHRLQLGLGDVGRQVPWSEWMPTSAQSACFMAT